MSSEPTSAFQEHCRSRLDAMLAEFGIEAHHDVLDYRDAESDAGERSVFVRSQFLHRGTLFDVYTYADEASASIGSSWYVFERRRFADENALTGAFTEFIRLCMRGEDPVDAFREVRGLMDKD